MSETTDLEMVRAHFRDDPFFLDCPIEIHSLTVDGDTTLHRAIQQESLEVVLALIRLGVDQHARGDMGNTALHYATEAEYFNRDIFLALEPTLSMMEIQNDFGKNVFDWASESGNEVNLRRYLTNG